MNETNIDPNLAAGLIGIFIGLALVGIVFGIISIYLQIKFFGLHRDTNKLMKNKSEFVRLIYCSFIPLAGIVFHIGGVYTMYTNIKKEFVERNIQEQPKSSQSAVIYLVSYIIAFLTSNLVSINSRNESLMMTIFSIGALMAVVQIVIFFIYWTQLYKDKVTLTNNPIMEEKL